MSGYSRQIFSPLVADGISLASFRTFRPIVEKSSFNAFAKSGVLFIETPFTITVKPLLSGHLRDLSKCPFNRGCPLNRGL